MTSKFIPPNPRQQMEARQPDLSLADDIKCEQCGSLTFQEVLLMKKVSALLSPNGKEGIVPIPTFSCVACGYVNEMFRPAYMQKPATPEPAETPKPTIVLEK